MSRYKLSTALLTAIILTATVTSAYAQDDNNGQGDVQAVNGKKVLTKPSAVATTGAVAAKSTTATTDAANGAMQLTGAAATGNQVKAEGAHDLKAKTGMVKSEGANDLHADTGVATNAAAGH